MDGGGRMLVTMTCLVLLGSGMAALPASEDGPGLRRLIEKIGLSSNEEKQNIGGENLTCCQKLLPYFGGSGVHPVSL